MVDKKETYITRILDTVPVGEPMKNFLFVCFLSFRCVVFFIPPIKMKVHEVGARVVWHGCNTTRNRKIVGRVAET